MSKIVRIAQREYVETIKSKVFVISVFLGPIFVVVMIFMSSRLARKSATGPRPPQRVAVIDLSGELSAELDGAFKRHNASRPHQQISLDLHAVDPVDAEARSKELRRRVKQGKLTACVIVDKDAVEGGGKSLYYAKPRNMADSQLFTTVRRLVSNAVRNMRYREHDLSPKLIAELQRPVSLTLVDLRSKTRSKGPMFASFMVPFCFLFLMFMGVFVLNQQLLTSLIEEKSSRVMEVLLSALSPLELMAGKILGMAVVGFTLVIVWAAAAYVAAVARGMSHLINAGPVGYFVVYYVLGFLLISSIFAALGSACNTMKEAQAIAGPLMIVFMVPMFTWFHISQNPEGTLAVILSFVPPLTPMIMMLRIAAHPELSVLQIVASIVILAASVPVVIWASARIFRTGVLMYGKSPTWRELLRWLRYS